MEYKNFIKIALVLTLLCCCTTIIFHSATTPELVAPEVEPTVVENADTQVQPDEVSQIEWSDGQTSNTDEYTPPAPVDENMWWDLNTVTKQQLCQINGIGEKTAQKILDYRDVITKYCDISELTEIDGIGTKKLETLKKYLYVKD